MNPIYRTFSMSKKFYVYDRSTNSILNLDKNEFDLLNQKDEEIIMNFREKGYLEDNTIEHIRHKSTDYLDSYLRNNLEQLTIQLTQNCNLRCRYCPYMGGYDNRTHSNKTASIDTIKRGIDYIFAHSQNTKQISFGFYGGEPLLEMTLLKEAVAYIEKIKEGRNIRLSLTTNGTLLSDATIEYFIEKNISVLLSLDGTKEYHDANRMFPNNSGSFDIIMENLKRIKQNYPAFLSMLSINSVISTDNDLSCTNKFFNANEVLDQLMINMNTVNVYNAKDDIHYNESFKTIDDFEICKLYLYMIGKISNRHVSKLYQLNEGKTHNIYKTLSPYKMQEKESHPGGPCLPGVSRLMMDVDGNFYPCERVSEKSEIMRIGNIEQGIDLKRAKYLLNVGSITEDECMNCFAFNFCKACCACCDGNVELSRRKKLSYCDSMKSIVLEEIKLITMLKEFNYNFEGLAYQ